MVEVGSRPQFTPTPGPAVPDTHRPSTSPALAHQDPRRSWKVGMGKVHPHGSEKATEPQRGQIICPEVTQPQSSD